MKKENPFSIEDTINVLKNSRSTLIPYLGIATSDFQDQPIYPPYILGQTLNPASDWEIEVDKKIKNGQETPEKLPNFYLQTKDYIKRSKELSNNMFRFSFDFGRLCPKEGEFNQKLMSDYIKIIALIKARGQEPMITLNHFTMPKFLLKLDKEGNIQKGGWENPDIQKHFQFYIKNVFQFLSDNEQIASTLKDTGLNKDEQEKILSEGLVKYFISINEPSILITSGYIFGTFPPFKKKDFSHLGQVLSQLVNAHDMTQAELDRSGIKNYKLGVAHGWNYFDGVFGQIIDQSFNKGVFQKFERTGLYSDFLGLQYYCRLTLPDIGNKDRNYSDHPEFGDIYPPGIYQLLQKMNHQYPQKEIFVTEFGFSDNSDKKRPYWIMETINYVLRAKKQGVPVRGMLLWTLINNFEWSLGTQQKFGLFDESELRQPLKSSLENEGVKSWEAWQIFIKTISNPNSENIEKLQKIYDTAKSQFENSK